MFTNISKKLLSNSNFLLVIIFSSASHLFLFCAFKGFTSYFNTNHF